jgi:hypothetical protein
MIFRCGSADLGRQVACLFCRHRDSFAAQGSGTLSKMDKTFRFFFLNPPIFFNGLKGETGLQCLAHFLHFNGLVEPLVDLP